MKKIVLLFTEIVRRFLPEPFVFALLLTLLTMVLAGVFQGMAPMAMVHSWGQGFWQLLAFGMQMSMILVMGYVLAKAPVTNALLNRIVEKVKTPQGAIIAATLVGSVGSYLNWGIGMVVGAIVAKKLALKVKGVHYPLIIASAYSGFTLYGLGFSSSIPIIISTPGHPMEDIMGIIPLRETIFAPPMILAALVVFITLPLLNAWLHPKAGETIIEINPKLAEDFLSKTEAPQEDHEITLATKLNNSRLLSYTIGIIGFIYIIYNFILGASLDINVINFIILFLGIILLKTPLNYINQVNEGAKLIGGFVLQFPFYAGIMALMMASGLVNTFSQGFVSIATPESLPLWGLISSFFINFFVPSAGGHWVLQGPFMIEAAQAIKSPLNQTAMSVMLGNAWNDLVQPMWLLPAMAISNLKLKDIMGYTVIMMFWVGTVYAAALWLWAYW